MKLMEKMRQKKLGNKGFSLVELIIVIAIMAILIGIIGTQVVPYLRRAREERDMQVINAYSTAAVTFYSLNTDNFVSVENGDFKGVIIFKVFEGKTSGGVNDGTDADWQKGFIELTGYSSINALKNAMVSSAGNTITEIEIIYNFDTEEHTNNGVTTPAGAVTATAYNGTDIVLETATSYIKGY